MKRWLCILLAMTMLLGLCACGGETPAEDNGNTTTASSTTTEAEDNSTTTTDTSATQADGTTTAGGTKPITKPVTKPTSSSDEGSAIRVLAIGDDYAVDAMEKYLYDMLKGAGYDKVQLGILYSTKSGVSAQYTAIKADSKTYEYRRNDNGKWQKESNIATAGRRTVGSGQRLHRFGRPDQSGAEAVRRRQHPVAYELVLPPPERSGRFRPV